MPQVKENYIYQHRTNKKSDSAIQNDSKSYKDNTEWYTEWWFMKFSIIS